MRQTTNSQSEDLFSKSMNKVERFGVFELILEGKIPVGSHIEVDCSAVFMKGDPECSIKGFYNADGEYRVRFMPHDLGIWRYEVLSSSVDLIHGEFACVENMI